MTDTFQTEPPVYRPNSHSRYQFLRMLNSGGLGVVSVHLDTELNREVALKEIKEEHADNPSCRNRFSIEAEVTGSLEHPGVVPIYSLGEGPDGRPYYAMRMISGIEFRGLIKQFHQKVADGSEPYLSPRLRELIRRLIEICNVVNYAHSRGVLHLDLKSSNVMIGRYGETLVIDWGLARTTGASEVKTPSINSKSVREERPVTVSGSMSDGDGSAIGTIAYAPPEQLSGPSKLIDSRSDSYSLGAILYEILTGDPPCKGMGLAEAVQAIENKQIPAASAVRKESPRSLTAIASKALSCERDARYQSAEELRDELQRWLDDEPVLVYQESRLERLSRWKRKHETFVRITTAALLLVTLTSVFAAHRINVARLSHDAARAEATQLYKLAREATDSLLTGASDQLREIPDSATVRSQLLRDAVESYQKMVAFPTHDPELRRDSLRVALKLAEVQRELGETEAGIEALEHAATMVDMPTKLEDRMLLSRVLVFKSRLELDKPDQAAAWTSLAQAFPLVDGAVASSNSAADALLLKGEALIQKGVLSYDEADWLGASESFAAANLSLRTALERNLDLPLLRRTRFQLIRACTNEAMARIALMFANNPRPSVIDKRISQRYDDALEQASWLVTNDPGNTDAAKEYGQALGNYAEHLEMDCKNIDAARTLYVQSLDFFSAIVAKQPAVPQYKERQVLALTGLANLEMTQGANEKAIKYLEKAVSLSDQMLLQNSVLLSFRRSAAQVYLAYGQAIANSDAVNAKEWLEKAVSTLPTTTETLPWSDEIRGLAETSLDNLKKQ